MDLRLSPDQAAAAELFHVMFAAESTPAVVREAEELGFSAGLWSRVRETGAPSLAVRAELGGSGAGLFEAVLAAEAAGFHLAPVPLIEHLVTARLLQALGAWDHLAAAVDAESVHTIALHPTRNGRLRLVPAGAVAGVILARHGDAVILVAGEPTWAAVPNGSGLPIADRETTGFVTVGTGPAATAAFDHALDEWRLLTAAALVGLADAALREGVAYVKQRHQFGVPIGTYQAIQHGLAEFPGPLSGARLLVQRAAWRCDDLAEQPGAEQPGAEQGVGRLAIDAPLALHCAAELARDVTTRVMHYHGGYGVMAETDIQLHYRRARGWSAQLGDPDEELDRVADLLYGAVV